MPKEGDTRPCERCKNNGEHVLQTFKLKQPVGSYVKAGEQLTRYPKPQDGWFCDNGHYSPD